MTQEKFIEKAKSVHGDRYDYSKVDYQGATKKVCIICPEHGEFWQIAGNHVRGTGCPQCGGTAPMNTKTFIEKARKIHGDKYNYDKVNYKGSYTKVIITCPIHGDFLQSPHRHLCGSGCPECGEKSKHENRKITRDEFIARARKVHGDRYDYSKVKFRTFRDKVCIVCPEHGEFWQLGHVHLRGSGCQKCAIIRRANKNRKNK